MDDSAGGRDLSDGPEGAEIGLWIMPSRNICVGLVHFILIFIGLNQLNRSGNTLTPFTLA